jgi:hypothetical protein
MTRRAAGTKSKRATRKSRSPRLRIPRPWPSAQSRRRWWRVFRKAPPAIQLAIGFAALLLGWFLTNGIYQVVLKPTELFFPVSGVLYKTPSQTWHSYERIFRKHSTATITPEFLAAITQVEGSGNPVVRTYWRWSLSAHPFKVYRPASSAVGMYQITSGTFAEARRYCIHDHVVVEDGPWDDFRSCWFNSLYMRVVPSHAVELTAAYLDRRVTTTLARNRIVNASLSQKHHLAAVIHLCGAGAGERYARRGLRLSPGQRCGDHLVSRYLSKVDEMKRVFKTRLQATGDRRQ